MKLFKSRKAISQLVATILLLAFAVALGSVVMSWGKDLIEKVGDVEAPESVEQSLILIQKCVDSGSLTSEEYNQISGSLCT